MRIMPKHDLFQKKIFEASLGNLTMIIQVVTFSNFKIILKYVHN